MASLYQQPKSSFWWVKFRGADGRLVRKSTGLRIDLKSEGAKATTLRDALTQKENEGRSFGTSGRWDKWVQGFLEQRYGRAPTTLQRYRNSWRNISAFFTLRAIAAPRQLTRAHVREFLEWRLRSHPDLGVFKGHHNTALGELKLLRIVMGEAIHHDFCTTNPCLALGVKKLASEEKPEITTEEHRKIVRALHAEPEWMRVAYAIAWHQGCRLRETALRLSQVDLEQNTITLRVKGGRELTTYLSPRLRPLFRRLLREGRTTSMDMPDMPSKAWWQFFKRTGLRHLCFHCTRVSFITRCYRAGLHEHEVMALVGHHSKPVHKVYRRLDVQRDLRGPMLAVSARGQ